MMGVLGVMVVRDYANECYKRDHHHTIHRMLVITLKEIIIILDIV